MDVNKGGETRGEDSFDSHPTGGAGNDHLGKNRPRGAYNARNTLDTNGQAGQGRITCAENAECLDGPEGKAKVKRW